MMKLAILAEDKSDADAIAALVERIAVSPKAGQQKKRRRVEIVNKKGFGGCATLRRKVARHMARCVGLGATHFIVCHDADNSPPAEIDRKISDAIRAQECGHFTYAIVVLVQELEAWILADTAAIQKVIKSLSIKSINSPERIRRPKEWLREKSRTNRTKPLYVPAVHNEQVMAHADITLLEKKCPSFKPLLTFVDRHT